MRHLSYDFTKKAAALRRTDIFQHSAVPCAVIYVIHRMARHTPSHSFISCFCRVAAEQKARTTYDNILRLTTDPDVVDPIRFLRAREIVHFQRFGEALRTVQDQLDSRNFYAFNPSFDMPTTCGTQN